MWSYSGSVHEFVAHGKWRLSATKRTYLFMANILVLSLTDSWVASCLQVANWPLLLEVLPPFVNLGNRKRLTFGTLALVAVKAPKVSHFLRYITYNTNAVNKVAISCLLFPIAVLALFKLQTSRIIHQPYSFVESAKNFLFNSTDKNSYWSFKYLCHEILISLFVNRRVAWTMSNPKSPSGEKKLTECTKLCKKQMKIVLFESWRDLLTSRGQNYWRRTKKNLMRSVNEYPTEQLLLCL